MILFQTKEKGEVWIADHIDFYINNNVFAPLIEKSYKEAAPYYKCGYPYGSFLI